MAILITGGAGFVGSNLAMHLIKTHKEIICLDNLKRQGSELNIDRLKKAGIKFIHGDIRNPEDLNTGYKIDLIIECSAEPSVMAGINSSPEYLINSNLIGALNCLEYARKNNCNFIFLSTSRVYPYDKLSKLTYEKTETRLKIDETEKGISEKGISEDFPLDGIRSIYGATKLCAEYMINEYNATYGIKTIINRFGVIAGPWQMGKVDQGVFTLWIARHHFKKDLKYIGYGGEGLQVRDLLHVQDLCELIELQIKNIDRCNNKIYNIGGGPKISLSLLETTKICEELTGNKIKIEKIKETRPVDIPWYITDNSKIKKELGWSPKRKAKEILSDIYDWLKNNEEQLRKILA